MNDLPRQKLREIVARHGRSVARDARRCEGLLRDCCGQYRREVSVLVSALEEHVPADLLAAPAGTPREVLLARLAHKLCDHLALSEPAARWAVNSWALALGLVPEDELKEFERRAAEPTEADADHLTEAPTATASVAAPFVVSATGGGDYTTITEALRHAAPGARVIVRPGVYAEGINIEQPVEIAGDGPLEEIIVESADASCLRMRADRARVAGLTLRGRARGGAAFFAVDISRGELLLEDCDVSSDTLSCVAVHGPGVAPSIRRCRIHDGADSGLYFFEGAAGEVEDCEVYGNANVGVAITGRADPAVRRSKIYGGANAGVVAWQEGSGLVEGCEIYGNRGAGLGVSAGATLTARDCRIYEGENSGVFVHGGGEAVLEGCELSGQRAAAAAVTTGGKLFLNGCRVERGRDSGVFVGEGGQALLQDCVVEGHAASGASVGAGSVLAVLTSQINRNALFAVSVAAGATARVEDSDLTGNGRGPWDVADGASVESERNREG